MNQQKHLEHENHHRHAEEPVAIIGIGCRLPGGADSPAQLWEMLRANFSAIGAIPDDRFDVESLYVEKPATAGKIMSRWGGFLEGIDRFDPAFFGIAPREAELLDPQQRLLLEVTWEALEDASLPPSRLAGTPTGVYVGMWLNDFEARLFANQDQLNLYSTTGTGRYSASGRISYLLDLVGPSLTIDTACSSSLVAVHLACQSLRSGESTVALAGGANVILQPHITIAYSQSRMMAPDGHCKFGDAAADGYVRSDGAAVVVLKTLSRALADGDPIYAVIRGSAVTNDGRSSGFLATPGQAGQEEMLRRAYANAAVDPHTVQYIEAHGTGTSAGDPVELGAIGAIAGVGRAADNPLLVGSVKTNLGHTEGAAGVAGMIKVALALKHRWLPASLHLQQPNPAIAWDDLHLQICATGQPWPATSQPARAGVSSFGIAGTNAHVVLEEAPARATREAQASEHAAADAPQMLALSTRAPEALRDLALRYRQLLAQGETSLADLCASAALGRDHLEHRLVVAARTPVEAIEALEAFAADEAHTGIASGATTFDNPKVAFIFPGQGSQWAGMARRLLADEPAFREAITACDAAIRAEAGWSLLERLQGDSVAYLDEIDEVQPTLFAIQVSLAALWRTWGVTPDAVVGHSMGEVAAAHVAGMLSLADAVKVICRRSKLLRRVRGLGAMAVVELALPEAQQAIAGYEQQLAIAVSNSPTSTVLSGDPIALEEVMAQLAARDIFCRRVKVDVASHSPQVDPLRADLLAALAELQPAQGDTPFYSTVLAQVLAGAPNDTPLDAAYWVRNLRQPVLFANAVQQLIGNGFTHFIELSPHPVLLSAVEGTLRHTQSEGVTVPSLQRERDEALVLRAGLGALHASGYPVDWTRHYPARVPHLALPTYPWQRERHWPDLAPQEGAQRGRRDHPLLGWAIPLSGAGTMRVWENTLTAAQQPHLYEHRLGGAPSLAAAAILDMLHGVIELLPGEHMLAEIRLQRLVALADDEPTTLQVVLAANAAGEATLSLYSRVGDEWTLHASAVMHPNDNDQAAPTQEIARLQEAYSAGDALEASALANYFAATNVQMGEIPEQIRALWRNEAGLLAALAPDDAHTQEPFAAAVALASLAASLVAGEQAIFMPTALQGLRVYAARRTPAWCTVQMQPGAPGDSLRADVAIYATDGAQIAALDGLQLVDFGQRAHRSVPVAQMLHTIEWRHAPLERAAQETPTGARWLILADSAGVGEALATQLRDEGARCVIAEAGDVYAAEAADRFTLRPAHADDMRRLLAETTADAPYTGVVFLWALDTPATLDVETLETAQVQGSGALALLASALAEQSAGQNAPARIWIATRGAQRVHADGSADRADEQDLAIAQSPIWGLGRALAQEMPDHFGALVDLDPAADAARAATALAHELRAGRALADDQVAWRADARFAPRLAPLAETKSTPHLPLRADGAYLITGGFGGLGAQVARWLVQQGARRLILMGRTNLPPRAQWQGVDAQSPQGTRIATMRALERMGAAVHVASLDVGDESALRAWLDAYRAEGWPPIRGVVHTAAIYDNLPINAIEPQQLQAWMRPKMTGAWLLHTLLEDLDLFVTFSSLTALMPQAGQALYAATNTFLDALAQQRARQGKPALSVNWGVWAAGDTVTDAAFQQRTDTAARLLATQGFGSISIEEGLDALHQLLRREVAQAACMVVDAPALLAAQSVHQRPLLVELASAIAALETAEEAEDTPSLRAQLEASEPHLRLALLETHIQQVAARVLKMPAARLDPGKPLGALGLDSLMAVELRNRLEVDVARKLSATLAWNYPTVHAIAKYILGRLELDANKPDTAPSEAVAAPAQQTNLQMSELVGTVDEMSDEAALLALMGGSAR